MSERLHSVPTLAELVARPELIDQLAPTVCGAYVVQLAALQAQLGARLAAVERPRAGLEPDELLDVPLSAKRLGVSIGTLYRRHHQAPYRGLVVENGTRRVKFSARRIAEYLGRGQAPAVHAPRRGLRASGLRAGGGGAHGS